MSKRNFIILIVILLILAIGAFVFFYFYKGKTTNGPDGNNNSYVGFGNSNQNSTGGDNGPTDISGYIPGDNTPAEDIKLKKISSMPIAGFGVYTRERFKEIPIDQTSAVIDTTGTTEGVPTADDFGDVNTTTPVQKPKPQLSTETEFFSALRYVARATGNIYETFADKINEQKFSATIIPKVYDAYFDNKAESVVMRYLKNDDRTIETFTGTLPKESLSDGATGDKELKGTFLAENIKDISLSADLTKIFYLFNTPNYISGSTSGVAGDNKSDVFSSAFTEWLSQWPNANMITVTTKPTYDLPGYMYAINPTKKDFSKVFGGIKGLTTLTSPDGKSVLYSDNKLGLHVYNIDTKNVVDVLVKTMAEKCVWAKASNALYCSVPKNIPNSYYPDSWYRGEVSFSDQVWEINTTDGTGQMVMDPITFPGGEDIDGTKLALDKDQNYLFFVNKKDSFLWEFNLR